MTNFETALQYQNSGLSIIPLWSPAEVYKNPDVKFNPALMKALAENSNSDNPLPVADIKRKVLTDICKTPLIYTWSDFQKRSATTDEVTRWFSDYTEANIGIVTGEVSGVIVIDIDSDDVFDRLNAQGKIPDTPMVKTGKGYHLCMRHPGFKVGNKTSTKIKIDIRGDGGYVVAPPSIHGSGASYEWVSGYSFFNIEPAECMPWMIDYISGKSPFEETSPDVAITKPESAIPNTKPTGNDDYAGILVSVCPEGERNQTATKLIGHLLGKGLNSDELWSITSIWNRNKCIPPMPENELRKTFASVCSLESGSRTHQPKIEIASFLDTPDSIETDYISSYVCIPFGRDNLQGLEKQMNGGLLGGNLYVLGGPPSAGKTAFINNIADNVCLNEHPVLFFSYDDTRVEIRNRTMVRFSPNFINQFNTRELPQNVIREIASQPLLQEITSRKYVVDIMISVEKWGDYIAEVQEVHKKPPVVIVDYMKKLRSSRRTSDERLRIEDIMMNLTKLAKTYNIPILVVSELARDSYKGGQKLSMASFKESGTIEYESSWLGILAAGKENDGQYVLAEDWENTINHQDSIDLIVFKAKRGTGYKCRVPLKVNRDKMLVTDRAVSDDIIPLKTKSRKKSQFGR